MDAAFADFSKFIRYELKKEQTEAISSVLSVAILWWSYQLASANL